MITLGTPWANHKALVPVGSLTLGFHLNVGSPKASIWSQALTLDVDAKGDEGIHHHIHQRIWSGIDCSRRWLATPTVPALLSRCLLLCRCRWLIIRCLRCFLC